jgi:hypothetical protein
MLVITVLKLSWGPNDFYASLRNYFDSVIRDYALNFHAKWLSMFRSHSLVTYPIIIFYFNIYRVEFYYGYNVLKLSWGPNDFHAFLRYFFDSVIRDPHLTFTQNGCLC